jgi:hypothetical protein
MTIKNLTYFMIIGALLVGGLFVNDYFNQSSAAQALTSQIQSQNQALSTLSSQTMELNTEIANDNQNVNKILNAIDNESSAIPSGKINSNDIVKAILNQSLYNFVSVVPLSTQDWSSIKTNGNDYQVFKMSLKVVGSQENVVQFIRQLPQLYNTLVIGSISLSKVTETPTPAATDTPDVTPAPVDHIEADLTLAIYTK